MMSVHDALEKERRLLALEEKIGILADVVASLEREHEKYASKASEGFLSLANLVDKIADRIKDIEGRLL